MRRRGVILIAVLVVTALAAMVAASLMYRVRSEIAASSATLRGEQAFSAAVSGVRRAMCIVRANPSDPLSWYDNPDLLKDQLVADDGSNKWYFSVWSPYSTTPLSAPAPDGSDIRHGLTDLASLININVASRETLLALPNMTEELVDCLIDYRDPDSTPLPNGAEQEYYSQLKQPYGIKNGPLSTLEELLLVKGFTARIVYGEDANLNGRLDPNEDDGDASFPPDNSDGQLDTGLRGSCTPLSYEYDVDNQNTPRVNLNTGKLPKELGKTTAEFVQLYRDEGNAFKHPSELLEMRYQLKKDHDKRKSGEWIESGVTATELPIVLDRLTCQTAPKAAKAAKTATDSAATSDATDNSDTQPAKSASTAPAAARLTGLVNVNTASARVLGTLPGIDAELAQRIAEMRTNIDPSLRVTTAWLVTQSVTDAGTFKSIAPMLTARGFQYHMQVVGFGYPCGRFRVLEAVIDLAGGGPARLLYLRDLTRLGMPFPVNLQQELR